MDSHDNIQTRDNHGEASHENGGVSHKAINDNDQAVIYIYNDKTEEAHQLLVSSLIKQVRHYFDNLISQGTHDWLARICLSSSYIDDTSLDKIYYLLELETESSTNKYLDFATFYDTIGNINYLRKNYKKAEQCLVASEKLKSKLFKSTNHVHLIRSTQYLAMTYLAWDKLNQAFKKHRRLLKAKRSHNNCHPHIEAKLNIILGEICFRQGFYSKCQNYFSKAEKMCSSQLGYKLEYIKSLIGLAKFKFALQIRSSSSVTPMKHLRAALNACPGQPNSYSLLKCEIYDNMAKVYMSQRKYEEASESLRTSWDIRNSICQHDNLEKAKSHFNEGNLKKCENILSAALSLHEKSLEIRLKLKPFKDLDVADSYQTIGSIYEVQKRNIQALKFYKLAKATVKSLIEDEICIISFHSYFGIGNILELLNRRDDSLESYARCLQIGKELFEKTPAKVVAKVYEKIGSLYSTQKNYTEALSNYKDAIEIYRRFKEHIDISRLEGIINEIEGYISEENRDGQIDTPSLLSRNECNPSSVNSSPSINTTDQNNTTYDNNSRSNISLLSTGNSLMSYSCNIMFTIQDFS